MDALEGQPRSAWMRASPACRVALASGGFCPQPWAVSSIFFAAAKVLGASVSQQCCGTKKPTHPKLQLSCGAKKRGRAGRKIGQDWKKIVRQRLGPLLLL